MVHAVEGSSQPSKQLDQANVDAQMLHWLSDPSREACERSERTHLERCEMTEFRLRTTFDPRTGVIETGFFEEHKDSHPQGLWRRGPVFCAAYISGAGDLAEIFVTCLTMPNHRVRSERWLIVDHER